MPLGIGLPGSVTWHTDMHPIERFFNVFYGYISFAIPIAAGVVALVTRGTRELLFVGSVVILVSINEFGLKNIILEPKPLDACAITCGMPSGHAATAIHYFVLLMLDYAFRVNLGVHKGQSDLRKRNQFKHALRLMSNSNVEEITVREFWALACLWGSLLLPVPFSRVANFDHTVKQVVVGSSLGVACWILTYTLYYALARTICQDAWQWPRDKRWHVLKNTIKLVGGPGAARAAPCKPQNFIDLESPCSSEAEVSATAEEMPSGMKEEASDKQLPVVPAHSEHIIGSQITNSI